VSNKKKQPTPKKVWQKLQRSPESDIREQRQRLRDQIKERFPDLTDKMIDAQENDETWGNDRYTVGVQYLDGNRDGFVELSVHNHNRTPHIPWRHLQQIKNEVLGADREAVQIHPSEDRLVDTANEFWLYVYPTGKAPMRRGKKLGMNIGRRVLYDTAPGIGRSRQTAEMSVAQ
jgi:hypothetical protein